MKKRPTLKRGDAILRYTQSVLEDCPMILAGTIDILDHGGYELKNQDEAIWVLSAGLLAMNTLGASQVLDEDTAALFYTDVGHFIDFLVESRSRMPALCREMYRFYCFYYAQRDREFAANPIAPNMPPLATCAAMLIHLISGYDAETDFAGLDTAGLQPLLKDFYTLVTPSLKKLNELMASNTVLWDRAN